MRKNILIADDHITVRLGINLLISDLLNDDCAISEVSNGKAMLNKLRTASFDMAVMDMNMPEPSGYYLLEQALLIQPGLKVLVLTVNSEELFSAVALKKGAYGFISKNADDVSLKKAMQKVLAGEMYIPKTQTKKTPGPSATGVAKNASPFLQLSARELEVTLLLLEGKGVLEVSNALSISQSTCSTLKGRVFRKLSIRSLLDLDRLAKLHGLIPRHAM